MLFCHRALGQRSNRASPWEKSITSSSVPWMISTGDVILDTFSILHGGVRKEMVTKRETERRKRIRYRERGGGKERKGKTKKNR